MSLLFGTGFGQMEVCLSFSGGSDMGLANLPALKEHRTSSSIWVLSDVTSSGTPGISAMHLTYQSMACLTASHQLMNTVIHCCIGAGGWERPWYSFFCILLQDLHPSCLGKLVLPFGEMPAANSAAVNISLGKQSCAYPAERWLHQTRTEPTNLGTGFKKCCSGPDVHLFCSEKRSPQALCSSQCNTGAEKVL